MSDGENEQVMTAREQRALIRQVQRLGENMNQNTTDVNLALRGLQQQMQQQGARLREDLNPVPGLAPHATYELEAYDGCLGVLLIGWRNSQLWQKHRAGTIFVGVVCFQHF